MPRIEVDDTTVDMPPLGDSTALVKKSPPASQQMTVTRRVAAVVLVMLLLGSYWATLSSQSSSQVANAVRKSAAKPIISEGYNSTTGAAIIVNTDTASVGETNGIASSSTTIVAPSSPSTEANGDLSEDKAALSTYEDTVAETLSCLKMGRKGNVMYYYSVEQRACLPLPRGFAERDPTKYVHPSDPTITTMMATIDRDGSGPDISTFDASASSEMSDTIVEKFSPSLHSRWLFDSWRLWEGEIACPVESSTHSKRRGMVAQEAAKDHGAPASEDVAPFNITQYITTLGKTNLSHYATSGEHNVSLPNEVYDLRNFCVDELTGALINFAEHVTVSNAQGTFEGDRPIQLDPVEALTEHIYGVKFLANERFFHPSNREIIPLVVPTSSNNGGYSWKRLISSSVAAHHYQNTQSSHNQLNDSTTTTPPPPEILFVEDQALLVSASGFEYKNPGHQFHRLGSALALARLLKPQSLLVLVDLFAEDPKERCHRTHRYTKGNACPDAALLPPYLITHVERHESGKDATPEFVNPDGPANPVVQLSFKEMLGLPSRPFRRDGDHMTVLELTMAEANSAFQGQMPFEAEFSPLLSSGETGCEDVRCGANDLSEMCTAEMKNKRRKCGRPYALINIALPDVQIVDADQDRKLPYRPDTQNYSSSVWGLAVRDTIRESKRVKRDIWLTAKGLRPINSTIPLSTIKKNAEGPADYSYLKVWRERMISLAASFTKPPQVFSERPPWQVSEVFHDYFLEYFAYQLESQHIAANKSGSPMQQPKLSSSSSTITSYPPRRQLICYQRAAVAQVFRGGNDLGTNPVAGIGLSQNANCELKSTLSMIYDSVWARYGMCMKDEEGSSSSKGSSAVSEDAQKNTNRDAHPIFTLKGEKQKTLMAAFSRSRQKISDLLKKIKVDGASLAQYNRTYLVSILAKHQNEYDDLFMKYFAWESDNAKNPKVSRPIRAFIAFRSAKRALTHWRHHLTAMMRDGVGRYVDFEFTEGMGSSAFSSKDPVFSLADPLNTARARQYHTYLSTDLYIGPHGADMHSSAFVKPSALVTELAGDGFDNTNMNSFTGGYFSSFAYARNVGYLRVPTHVKYTTPEHTDSWASEHQSYMSLPDMRQMLSVSVCSWLAMNAVRLADEERNATAGSTSTDFSYLVPWWCRGGSKVIANDILNQLKGNSPPQSLHEEQDQYFDSRLGPTTFGFACPRCPPLRAGVTATGLAEGTEYHPHSTLELLSSAVTQSHLNRLQTECAYGVAVDNYLDTPQHAVRRHAEGLQSLIESLMLVREESAQEAARLMVQGVQRDNAALRADMLLCGESALNVTNVVEGKRCLVFMLEAFATRMQSVNTNLSPSFVQSLRQMRFPLETRSSNPIVPLIVNATLRGQVINYIADQFLAAPARPTVHNAGLPLLTSDEFSYGWKCPYGKVRK